VATRRTLRPDAPRSAPGAGSASGTGPVTRSRETNARPGSDPPSRGETLSAALLYADLGWHLFPVRAQDGRPALHDAASCPRTGGCAEGHIGWEQRATVDPDQIVDCWSTGPTPFGLGIATGPSRLVVIALDVPHGSPTGTGPDGVAPTEPSGAGNLLALACRLGEEIPPTFTVRTGRGGRHLYYTHRLDGPVLGNTTGRIVPRVGSSAHGGYVVAAPSVVAGRPFVVLDARLPVPLPPWMRDRLVRPPVPEGGPGTGPQGAA